VKLQKEVISTHKQPSCKKGMALFKMASVKKAMKSKYPSQPFLATPIDFTPF